MTWGPSNSSSNTKTPERIILTDPSMNPKMPGQVVNKKPKGKHYRPNIRRKYTGVQWFTKSEYGPLTVLVLLAGILTIFGITF